MGVLKLTGYTGEAEILGAPRRITVDEKGFHVHDVSLNEASDIIQVLSAGRLEVYQPAGTQTKAAAFIFTAESVEIPTSDHAERCGCTGDCHAPPEQVKVSSPREEEAIDGDVTDGESTPESPPQKPVKPTKPTARATRKKTSETVEKTEADVDDDSPNEDSEISVSPPKRRTRAAAAAKKSRSVADDMVQDPPEEEEVADNSADSDDAIVVDPEEEAGTEETASGGHEELFGALLPTTSLREVIDVFRDHGIKDLPTMQKKAQEFQLSVPVLKNVGPALATRLGRTFKGMPAA